MWVGVTRRFQRFHAALQLTSDEFTDGTDKHVGIRQSLQRAYWGPTTNNPPGFTVGSWGKRTAIRPPNDIDVFVPLPFAVYQRLQTYSGNRQSSLLQEVKNNLLTTYSQTNMRGDGQVVVVAFNTVTIEVVPVFQLDDTGTWLMPDANDGGQWRLVYPFAEQAVLDRADMESANNCRPLIQIMKSWKYHCNVPIKSFHLEQLVALFIRSYMFRDKNYFFYDWFVRDFLYFLLTQRNATIYAPASSEYVSIGDQWFSRATTAYDRAAKACEYERDDYVILAGEEWQKIFGSRIPAYLG